MLLSRLRSTQLIICLVLSLVSYYISANIIRYKIINWRYFIYDTLLAFITLYILFSGVYYIKRVIRQHKHFSNLSSTKLLSLQLLLSSAFSIVLTSLIYIIYVILIHRKHFYPAMFIYFNCISALLSVIFSFIVNTYIVKSKPISQFSKHISVMLGRRQVILSVSDIAYFFAQEKYVFVITFAGEKYLYDRPLDQIDQSLNPEDFFRLNRKFIASIKAIKEIQPYFKGRLKIILLPPTQAEVIISNIKTPKFRKWIKKL